jgi:hypothetical protein
MVATAGRPRVGLATALLAAFGMATAAAVGIWLNIAGGDSTQPSAADRKPVAGAAPGSEGVLPPDSEGQTVATIKLPSPSDLRAGYLRNADKHIAVWQEEATKLSRFERLPDAKGAKGTLTRAVLADWESKLERRRALEVQIVTRLVLLIERGSGRIEEADHFVAYGIHEDRDGSLSFTPFPVVLNQTSPTEGVVLLYLDSNGRWQAFALSRDGVSGWHSGEPESARLIGAFQEIGEDRNQSPSIVDVVIDPGSISDSTPGIRFEGQADSFHINSAHTHRDITEAYARALVRGEREPRALTGMGYFFARD